MIRISPHQRDFIYKLYLKSAKIKFPLIMAVIKGLQEGEVFINKGGNLVFVINKFGFCQLVGKLDDLTLVEDFIENILFSKEYLNNYLLWYDVSEEIKDSLRQQNFENFRDRVRIQMKLDVESFKQYSSGNKIQIDQKFTLEKLRIDHFPYTSHLGLDLDIRFWRSAEDLISNGFGYCITDQKKVVSICYSACIVDRITEIDVITDKEYQGNNFGKVVTDAFIHYSIEKDYKPNWDCFDYNSPSLKIARKMGFVDSHYYSLCSFNRFNP